MNVKMLVMDVDGTLTDGKIYYSSDGSEMKSFNIKDGYAIKHYLKAHNIIPVIITGRVSSIVERRAVELGIDEIHQGVEDKCQVLNSLLTKYQYTYDQVAYIGDDIIDIECMKMCGHKACPADAAREVIAISDFVSHSSGGEGAVREYIEYLIKE